MVDVPDADQVPQAHLVDPQLSHQAPVSGHEVLVHELGVELGPRAHDPGRELHGYRATHPPALRLEAQGSGKSRARLL